MINIFNLHWVWCETCKGIRLHYVTKSESPRGNVRKWWHCITCGSYRNFKVDKPS